LPAGPFRCLLCCLQDTHLAGCCRQCVHGSPRGLKSNSTGDGSAIPPITSDSIRAFSHTVWHAAVQAVLGKTAAQHSMTFRLSSAAAWVSSLVMFRNSSPTADIRIACEQSSRACAYQQILPGMLSGARR
jgi:hypothetical protein